MGTKSAISLSPKYYDYSVKLKYGLELPEFNSFPNLYLIKTDLAYYAEWTRNIFGQINTNFDYDGNNPEVDSKKANKLVDNMMNQINDIRKTDQFKHHDKFLFNSLGNCVASSCGIGNEFIVQPNFIGDKVIEYLTPSGLSQQLSKIKEGDLVLYSVGRLLKRLYKKHHPEVIALLSVDKINGILEKNMVVDDKDKSLLNAISLASFILYCEYYNSLVNSRKTHPVSVSNWNRIYDQFYKVGLLPEVVPGMFTEELWNLELDDFTAFNLDVAGDEVVIDDDNADACDFLLSEILGGKESIKQLLVDHADDFDRTIKNYGYLVGFADVDIETENNKIPVKDIVAITFVHPKLHITLSGYNWAALGGYIEKRLSDELGIDVKFSYLDSEFGMRL